MQEPLPNDYSKPGTNEDGDMMALERAVTRLGSAVDELYTKLVPVRRTDILAEATPEADTRTLLRTQVSSLESEIIRLNNLIYSINL